MELREIGTRTTHFNNNKCLDRDGYDYDNAQIDPSKLYVWDSISDKEDNRHKNI